MASAPPLYRIEGLTKTYGEGDAAVQALRGVNLDVQQSAMVILLGPSGSGKSTFLNIVGGLDQATSGHVHFEDIELTSLGDHGLTEYRRHHVGFVFQFYNLVASLTARENVALITEIAEEPMEPAEALALVGLESRLDHFPPSFRGVSNSALPSRAPSPNAPRCFCAMNPPARSTARRGYACWRHSIRSTASSVPPRF